MSIEDKFKNHGAGRTDPAGDAFGIAPNDSSDLPQRVRAIYCGSDGDISLVTPLGNEVVFVGVKVGTILPVSADRIKATGTTAMDLVGLV